MRASIFAVAATCIVTLADAVLRGVYISRVFSPKRLRLFSGRYYHSTQPQNFHFHHASQSWHPLLSLANTAFGSLCCGLGSCCYGTRHDCLHVRTPHNTLSTHRAFWVVMLAGVAGTLQADCSIVHRFERTMVTRTSCEAQPSSPQHCRPTAMVETRASTLSELAVLWAPCFRTTTVRACTDGSGGPRFTPLRCVGGVHQRQ